MISSVTWQRDRAIYYVDRLRESLVSGVTGADNIDPLLTSAEWEAGKVIAEREARRFAHALFGALYVIQPWEVLNFFAGWEDYNPIGSTYHGGAYTIDPFGRVLLRGLVKRTSGTSTTIATLPPLACPAARKIFGGISADVACRIDIDPSGAVILYSGGTATNYVSLEGISFDARG